MKKAVVLFANIINALLFAQSIENNYNITWTEQNSGVTSSLNSVTYSQFSFIYNAWICGNNGTVLKTYDYGESWSNVGKNGIPVNINLMNISVLGSGYALVSGKIANTAVLYRTTDDGESWGLVFLQENGFINGTFFREPLTAFIQGNPVGGRWSFWISSDLGETWDSTGMYVPQDNNELGINNSLQTIYGMDYMDRIWFGTNNNRIYYSSNSGLNWIFQNIPEQNIYSLSHLWYSEIACGNNLWKSSDNGITWYPMNSLGIGIINGISVSSSVLIPPYNKLNVPTPWFYIRNSNNIYYADNLNPTWVIKYQAPSGIYNHISNSFQYFWAVRNNGGITRGKFDLINNITQDMYPYSIELMQNYPNPFNPKTKIRVAVHAYSVYTLKIYNSSGKFIQEFSRKSNYILFNNNPFTEEYEWDGTNYPSGIYYIQIKAFDYTATKKIVLVK